MKEHCFFYIGQGKGIVAGYVVLFGWLVFLSWSRATSISHAVSVSCGGGGFAESRVGCGLGGRKGRVFCRSWRSTLHSLLQSWRCHPDPSVLPITCLLWHCSVYGCIMDGVELLSAGICSLQCTCWFLFLIGRFTIPSFHSFGGGVMRIKSTVHSEGCQMVIGKPLSLDALSDNLWCLWIDWREKPERYGLWLWDHSSTHADLYQMQKVLALEHSFALMVLCQIQALLLEGFEPTCTINTLQVEFCTWPRHC